MTIPGGLMAMILASGRAEQDGTHTLDAKSNSATGTSDPRTHSHTCAADATVLVVYLGISANLRTGGAPTYNGVAMTQAGSTQDNAETVAEVWYMIDPPSGANTISVPNPATSMTISIHAASFISSTGKSELEQTVGSGSTSQSSPWGDTVTPVKDGCVIVQGLGNGNGAFSTSNTATLLAELDHGVRTCQSQYFLQATAAAKAMTFSWISAAEDYTSVCAVFKPM